MTSFEARRLLRIDLAALTQRLIVEFAGELPAGTVIRCIARAREELLATGVRTGLATAIEFMARTRLVALIPAHAHGT